ncbi:DUF2459 domain-containing protein [Verrucomicrobiaceae bacterium R5-34]|nr:DUF2459 domain-containing protein [Verrucomicrobiaceae bacterium R5-34]
MKGASFLLVLTLLSTSCSITSYIKTPRPAAPHQAPATQMAEDRVRIQVYSHGWHAGLVVPASALRRHAWTEDLQIAQNQYVELGWGSEEFYRTEGLNTPMIVRGLFWPTAAVMHIERFDESPYQHYPYSQLETFDLTEEEADRLVTRLSRSFARSKDDQGKLRLIDLGPGLKPNSSYYRSRSKYFYPQTCNIWTANLLRAAGIQVRRTTRSPKLMEEIRESPRLVR